jgi:hypothetical protein
MNDEMAMKQRGGTRSKIVVERMLNVFDLHFPAPAVEAMSRIYACKTERNLQIFGWCLQFKQSCPWATLSYCTFVCKTRQGNQRNEASRLRKCIKRAQCYQLALNAKKSPCKLNSLPCRQKTTTSL